MLRIKVSLKKGPIQLRMSRVRRVVLHAKLYMTTWSLCHN